jgi:predicted MFS family arabinose efflux permease
MSVAPAARPMSDRGAYTYIAVFSAALYTVLLIAPVVAGKLAQQFGLTATQVGLIFSFELGAFSLATVPAYLWLRRVDLRTASYIAGTLVVLGNVASGFVTTYPVLVVVRFLTALAAGSITVIILSLSGRTSNPSRAFGIFVVCQLAMGALIIALFPVVFATAPVAAVYWTLAVLTALCLPVVRLIDGNFLRRPVEPGPAVAAAERPTRTSPVKFVLGLGAVLCFYIALSGVWTFMEAVGKGAGNGPGAVAITLSIATVAGIASALLATMLGDSPHRRLFLLGGYLGMALSVALLFGGPVLLRFAVAAIIFKFAWTFILPYLLSALSDLSTGGHVMNTTNLMIGTGFAIGPLLGGVLIDSAGGGFTGMLTLSLVGVLASLLLILAAYPRRHDHVDHPVMVDPLGEDLTRPDTAYPRTTDEGRA